MAGPDAGGAGPAGLALIGGQADEAVGVLDDRGVQLLQGDPHHGPPGEHQVGLLPQSPRGLQQDAEGGPDGDPEVAGPGDRAAGDGDRPVGQGPAAEQGVLRTKVKLI